MWIWDVLIHTYLKCLYQSLFSFFQNLRGHLNLLSQTLLKNHERLVIHFQSIPVFWVSQITNLIHSLKATAALLLTFQDIIRKGDRSSTLFNCLPLKLLKDFEIATETKKKSLTWFVSRGNEQDVAGPSMKWNERGNEQMEDVLWIKQWK